MHRINTGFVRIFIGAFVLAVIGFAPAFAAPALNLPPGSLTPTVTFDASFGLGAYFNVVFGTPPIPPGYDVVQGVKYLGWCVDFNDNLGTVNATGLTTLTPGPYTLYNSYGPLPANAQSPNWGAVNWLLNNKGANSVVDIQEAIWFLLDGQYHTNFFITSAPSAASVALVNAALSHTGFIAAPGQTVAVFIDSGDGLLNDGVGLQDLIIEVKVPSVFTGCTVTQGGWGAPPHGNNPGALLQSKFPTVFPSGVTVGVLPDFNLHFTSAAGIKNFLPQGGTPGALNASAVDPTSSSAGVFAGQVLALQLNANVEGLSGLVLTGTGTSLDGDTVAQILVAANTALGGGGLPSGFTFSALNDLIDNLNQSFDDCSESDFATAHLLQSPAAN